MLHASLELKPFTCTTISAQNLLIGINIDNYPTETDCTRK